MNKAWVFLMGLAGLLSASAGALLPGSLDFDTPALWDKEVKYGLNDDGSMGGETHWYVDGEGNYSMIRQRLNSRPLGYLSVSSKDGLHRTIPPTTSTGPRPADGRDIPNDGLYIDSTVSLAAFSDWRVRTTSPNDKLVVWVHTPADGPTNLIVTAGFVEVDGSVTPTNYVVEGAGTGFVKQFRFVARALTNAVELAEGIRGTGFELWADGHPLTHTGGQTVFPSLQQGVLAANKLYSLGFTGSCSVEDIYFTGVDPQENPEYTKDDTTMLSECATFTVEGGVKAALFDFPLLVRISEDRIRNFYYSRTASGGGDIRFTDENGKLLSHEIDTWNPDGESLIWVKMPYLTQRTKLTMHWALKPGGSAPRNSAREVWSDYVAVWHMNTADRGSAKDSTGNGYIAKPTDGTLVPAEFAPIGMGGALPFMHGTQAVECVNIDNALKGGNFTFTGWYVGRGYPDNRYGVSGFPICGSKNLPSLKYSAEVCGWAVYLTAKTWFRYYFNGDSPKPSKNLPDLSENWFHTALVYSNGVAQTYSNGTLDFDGEVALTPTNLPFRVMSGGSWGDEIRVCKVPRSAAWIAAECEQATNLTFVSKAEAGAKDKTNYWIEEPSVSPTAWATNEIDSVHVSGGQPRYGVTMVTFYDAEGHHLTKLPNEIGYYTAVFTAGDGTIHDVITKTVNLVVFEHRPYRDVVGSDRVMLFNSDYTPGSEVRNQGFWDADASTNLVWDHTWEVWEGDSAFVQDGAFHVYRDPETRDKLWEFRHARIGNLFQTDAPGLVAGMNYLPWNTGYSRRYDDSELKAERPRYAGVLLLQNVAGAMVSDPAAAYSPWYTNGVGTVYFDAVNSYADFANALELQVCRAAPGESAEEGAWSTIPVTVFPVVDGVYDRANIQTNVTSIALAVQREEGARDCFYRIRAEINETTPIRFRIVRTDTNWGAGGVDGAGLIAVDNIIASAPAMGLTLEQYGAPADPNDRSFRGQKAPFSIAFPSGEDIGTLRPLVKVNYIVNGTNVADSSFVGALTCTYRWRYLNQKVGEWREILMAPSEGDNTRFVGTTPFEGDGEGDIEYFFNAEANAPYYDYVDYSGLGLSFDDYTERRGGVRINALADGVYDAYHLSPALGTNYFVRLRAGRSDYEGFRLNFRRDDDPTASYAPVAMTLVANHTWRGYLPTPTNLAAGVLWQLEAINPQTAPGTYVYATNWYSCVDADTLPFNAAMTLGSTNSWARVPVDAATGYLMFQYDDETHAVAVIHADYQNVNAWTDANRDDGDENGHFVGTSVEDDLKSGVSVKARNFALDFADFKASIPTNSLWVERFVETVTEDPASRFCIEIPFTTMTTPNGWGAANGMWMPQLYRQMGTKNLALQLEGEGRGMLTFQVTNPPRGIGEFSFNARVSQAYDIYSYNYYRGTNEYYNLKNYAFAVPCVLKSRADEDFEGLGSVSAVAYYDDGSGCYEARVERVAANSVRLCLYKWAKSRRQISTTLLTKSADQNMTTLGFSGVNATGGGVCGALFISCENQADRVLVQAGIRTTAITVENVGNQTLSGEQYLTVTHEDKAADRHTGGTMGVGTKDCPGAFAAPQFYAGKASWGGPGTRTVTFGPTKELLISNEDDYDAWTVREGRLDVKDRAQAPVGFGFAAAAPYQTLLVETAPHGSQAYTVAMTNEVTTYGFTAFTNELCIAETVDVRVRTGGARGDDGADVTVDEFVAWQWAGENYNTEGNPNADRFTDLSYGSPTNFVYTAGWTTEDGGLELSAMRTTENVPASLRAPLMDGSEGCGTGLGMISFAYRDADEHCRLKVQVYTNGIDRTWLAQRTRELDGWSDVSTIDFRDVSAEQRKGGIMSAYLGLHGVSGVMRVVVDPESVKEARNPIYNPTNAPTYGRVVITSVAARDNPALDHGSWWGWNIRTTDDEMMWMLEDASSTYPKDAGLSLALNNSITDDIRPDEKDAYHQHKPFVQTPIFSTGEIGEISFKARKYSASDPSPTVAIYGTSEPGEVTEDTKFELLEEIVIDSERYTLYSYQTPVSKKFYGFRLAITGVPGVDEPGPPPRGGNIERVLLDELSVFEAVRTRVGFRNTRAFRSYMDFKTPVPDILSKAEQPLCNESWSIQTEIYKSQLGDDIIIDDTTQVRFRWYEGTYPWGGTNWYSVGKVAQLARAEGTDQLIYRGGYLLSPGAVVGESKDSGTIVQYALEVIYHNAKGETVTNTLTAADWQKPEWYRGIDCNATYGYDGAFSAYNILDTVPYGYAWFNEVNVYDGIDPDNNLARTNQYIEIAIPREADISGWRLEFVSGGLSDGDPYYTNVVARFSKNSTDVIPTKNYSLGGASNYVFITVGNPFSCTAETKAKGTIDGVWSIPASEFPYDQSQFYQNGLIYPGYPMGIQLVRKSGIVEHQIVIQGTNSLAESAHYGPIYSATNYVKRLRERYPESSWYYTGDDMDKDPTCGVSVTQQFATASADWAYMTKTPGTINLGEYINPDHPIPSGSSVIIYCDVVGDHIRHSAGGDYSTDSLTLVVPAGSEVGTNITYVVDRWYEIGAVTTNGVAMPEYAGKGVDGVPVTVRLGVGCSNAVSVTASARVEESLRTTYGLTEDNYYTPAVMTWLERGMTKKWGEFASPSGKIELARYIALSGVTNRLMALTEMYWLDMDPTMGNLILKAGMCKPPKPVAVKPTYTTGDDATNLIVGVLMMISNETDDVESPYHGAAWAPYTLRGLAPNSSSDENSSNWTSVTFKITGYLNNGKDDTKPAGSIWLPLRYFVFNAGSFDENYQALIELDDPFKPPSPAYYQGWADYDTCSVWFRWNLDTRLAPAGVEMLQPVMTNCYPEATGP